MLHARLAPTVTAEGLSPWSRDFARQAQSDPRLRERLARPARVEAVNAAFAGFTREVDPRSVEATLFKPYRWVRLVWPNDSDGASLKEHHAFESLIGTSSKDADSDADGRPDDEELPFAALPVSDPLIADGANPCIPR